MDCPNHVRRTKSSIKKRIIVRRSVRSMFGEQTFDQLRTGFSHIQRKDKMERGFGRFIFYVEWTKKVRKEKGRENSRYYVKHAWLHSDLSRYIRFANTGNHNFCVRCIPLRGEDEDTSGHSHYQPPSSTSPTHFTSRPTVCFQHVMKSKTNSTLW